MKLIANSAISLILQLILLPTAPLISVPGTIQTESHQLKGAKLIMETWQDHTEKRHGGKFLIEFDDGVPTPKQAFLSWSRPMSPDDPEDDAREVIMLGIVDGPWESRDAALAICLGKAEQLLADSGYIQ